MYLHLIIRRVFIRSVISTCLTRSTAHLVAVLHRLYKCTTLCTSCQDQLSFPLKSTLKRLENRELERTIHFVICEDNLKEVRNSSSMLFSDMCRVFGVEGAKNLSPSTLNKNSVSKAQMAEFLFTAVYLLDHCCLPLMSSATSQLETLQSEKISDQKTIIELQQDLISKKNEELGEVSKSVEAGLKTYSSALQQSCTKALSRSNIAAAVKTVTQEEDRSKELVLFGVTEEAGERVTTQVTKVLEQINEKPQVRQCRRIGQPNAGAARPIIFASV